MKVRFNASITAVTLIREADDPRPITSARNRGGGPIDPSSLLLYWLRIALVNAARAHAGKRPATLADSSKEILPVIKARCQDDGHLFGFPEMQYIRLATRTRAGAPSGCDLMIYDGDYAIRAAAERFDECGEVTLTVEAEDNAREYLRKVLPAECFGGPPCPTCGKPMECEGDFLGVPVYNCPEHKPELGFYANKADVAELALALAAEGREEN